MEKSRTIFIGDVQGCFDELKLLIKRLKLSKNDKVYFVGDLINRGPKSYKVLKYMYKNKDNFFSVKGNHELNFLRWLKGETYTCDRDFKVLRKKIEKNDAEHLIKYLEELPLYIEKENFILLHGGTIPNKKISDLTEDEITRTRLYNGKPWYDYYTGDKKIIYGHWAEEGIQIRKNTIGIDSGCVYGKALTVFILETNEIIQQSSLDIYVNVFKKHWSFFKKLFN